MIYLSLTGALVIFLIGLLPFYIAMAGWSFKYYSIKANSSSLIIEDFKEHVRFPANVLFRGNPSVIRRIVGKEFANSDLNQVRFQRVLILIVVSLFHIPLVVGICRSVAEYPYDALYIAIVFIFSSVMIIISMRFGHSLLINVSS